MPADRNVVAIIGARGGSQGLPRKNIRLLAGKPLVAWTIEAARASRLIDRVIISTDDDAIAHVCRQFGAEVPFMRPAELSSNEASSESYLVHALEWLETNEGYRVDIVVYLQATDVFRTITMIDGVVQALLDDPALDSAFVAYATFKNYWKKQDGRYVPLSHRGYGPRQKKKELVYREDTGIACATRASIVRTGRRIGDNVLIIENEDFCTGIDIHSEFDLWLAEKVITEWGRQPNE